MNSEGFIHICTPAHRRRSFSMLSTQELSINLSLMYGIIYCLLRLNMLHKVTAKPIPTVSFVMWVHISMCFIRFGRLLFRQLQLFSSSFFFQIHFSGFVYLHQSIMKVQIFFNFCFWKFWHSFKLVSVKTAQNSQKTNSIYNL